MFESQPPYKKQVWRYVPGTPALGRQVEGLLGLAGQLVQGNRLAPDSVRDCLTK